MHLSALKINGFKSFADQTQLRFEPGVTAVVGPNGCGKSNIADAVRWVLGEQSAKALRGGKMQDVIFEGTDKRKPVNLCEVSLVLTDCEKELGSEFNEIEIGRRAHRDGGSDYFINGKSCRLKDIQRLFMDTGIGRTSYSIMAQGQIDQILSSKPEERRAVFEEAAGISKYKSQRKEALNKLSHVDANLSRVTDVIGEISRQIGSLKRQATKAIRYKKLSHKLRHLDVGYCAHQFGELRGALSDIDRSAGSLTTEVDELQESLQTAESKLTVYKEERQLLIRKVQDTQQSVFDLRSAKEQAANQSHLSQIKITSLQERIEQAQEEIENFSEQIGEIAGKLDASSVDKQLHLDVLGNSDEIFQERNRELAEIEAQLESSEREIQSLKIQSQDAERNLHQCRAELSSIELESHTSQDRLDRLNAEKAEHAEAQERAQAALAHCLERGESLKDRRESLEIALEEAREHVSAARDKFRAKQTSIIELDRAAAQKAARVKLLQQLQEKLEGYGEGAKAALKGRLLGPLEGRSFAALTAALSVKDGYAGAIEALLGSAVEAVAVGEADTVIEIFRQLEEKQIGRICVKLPSAASAAPGVALPGWLRPALDCIDSSAADDALRSTLGASYVADDISAFLKWREENPSFNYFQVASKAGEFIDSRGVATGGYRKANNSGILQREQELKQLTKELVADQAAVDAARKEAEAINRELESAEEAVEETRHQLNETSREISGLVADTRNAEKLLEEQKGKAARFVRENELLQQTLVRSGEKLAGAQERLGQHQAKLDSARSKIERIEVGLGELRADRDEKREALSQAKFDFQDKKQRLDVLNQGLVEMEQRRGELTRLIDVRTRDIADREGQIATEKALIDRSQSDVDALEAEHEEAKALVSKTRDSLIQIEEKVGVLEKEQNFMRSRLDDLKGNLGNQQVQIAEKRSRLEFVQEEMQREYNVDLRLIDWKWEMWKARQPVENLPRLDAEDAAEDDDLEAAAPAAEAAEPVEAEAIEEGAEEAVAVEEESAPSAEGVPAPAQPSDEELAALDNTNWKAIQAEVNALRKRIQNLGAVNLVAIEEYGELRERHLFLKTQYDDLISSKEKLVAAIDEINIKSKEQFSVTFEQIRENFKSTFGTLFSGGKADLQLIETDDVLESGIDIVAQPPSTRLKSITLLSGGQKTMTAVALLFAIYQVKPSPFCVLDELDAPLDESNIGRFTTLLKRFTQHSQFIIITHNKRTIQAAQAIYGVTMEEKGVSKVVSMKFNSSHEDPDAVTLQLAAATA